MSCFKVAGGISDRFLVYELTVETHCRHIGRAFLL
jgi:hypothetical protein